MWRINANTTSFIPPSATTSLRWIPSRKSAMRSSELKSGKADLRPSNSIPSCLGDSASGPNMRNGSRDEGAPVAMDGRGTPYPSRGGVRSRVGSLPGKQNTPGWSAGK